MDCHSGVFESKKWRWLLPLQRFHARRAVAVIVTNVVHARQVEAWRARPLIIGDPPLTIPEAPSGDRGPAPDEDGVPFVFVVNRFHRDEAVSEVVAAAALVPEVRVVVSGDLKRADPDLVRDAPQNLRFTGWLTVEDFWECARRATAIVVLTTTENTILRGGWEAMYLGKPLVTSSSRALREYFTNGAVFVDNTAEGMAAGIRDALSRADELASEMASFRDAKYQVWELDRARLEEALGFRFDQDGASGA